jgi:UDP-N-acetylmuramate dehydrogenase
MMAGAVGALDLDKRIQGVVKFNERLARHTSLRIGGPADVFVLPRSREDICEAIRFAGELDKPWMVLGNGTNLLFPDAGYPGVVIKMGLGLGRLQRCADRLIAQAGVGLMSAITQARRGGFADLDMLVGIPGSIGGALAMNAGIPEGSIADVTRRVTVLTSQGKLITLMKDECGFGYRRSRFQEESLVIVEGEFILGRDKAWDGEELLRRRRERQPLGVSSPGCVFKNPEGAGLSAGQLIDRAGLKGKRIGGAAISTKHANFIINEGGATSKDVLQLIDIARGLVLKYFGIELKLELAVIS